MYYFLSIFLCLSFFSYVVSAQDSLNSLMETQAQALKSELKKAQGKAQIQLLNQLSEFYQNSQPEEARNYAQKAIKLANKLNDKKGEAKALKNVGIIYQLQGNYSQGLRYFLNALQLYEKLADESGIAQALNNIGTVYQYQGKFAEARKYYDRVLEIDNKIKDKKGEASTLNNIGDLYYRQDDFEKALEYYNKSLKIRDELKLKDGIAVSLKNIGLVNYTQTNYQKALVFFLQSIKIDEELKNEPNIAATANNIANTHLKLEQLDTALVFAERALAIAERIQLKQEIADASFTLSDIYATLKNYEKAYEYQLSYLLSKDELFNEENTKKITDLQISYEMEKKDAENNFLEKRNQIYQVIFIVGFLVFILIIVLAVGLYRNNLQKQAANNLLIIQNAEINQQKEEIQTQRDAIEAQRDEIEKQRNEITVKNTNIESSIRYAQRIQQAMLPYEHRIDEQLPLHFILYRPRDVVSGDFYWYAKVEGKPIFTAGRDFDSGHSRMTGFSNEKVVLAAVDCTGHGVPGAFMSMIGDALLNQIVIDKGITEADLIMNEMHKGIRKALKQSETQNRDGMDMAICVFDFNDKTVEYAGAKNSLIYIQNSQVQEINADKFSVGGYREDGETVRRFKKHTLSFEEEAITLYMYSDGFQDQFGGPEDKKFMRKRFKQLLFEIYKEPMSYQEEILEKTIVDWMGEHNEQMDDILVMGVRVE